MRFFDPRWVGTWEQLAWEAYYRKQWAKVLVASIGLVRCGFRMGWIKTVQGAYFVLRANQLWAPQDNHPAGARRYMARFYDLVAATYDSDIDTDEAAELEVEWWRVHREVQNDFHRPYDTGEDPLTEAITDLYSYVFDCELDDVRPAAALRAEAMVVSDTWVEDGCDPDSELLDEERQLLIRSYSALLAAVHK